MVEEEVSDIWDHLTQDSILVEVVAAEVEEEYVEVEEVVVVV